MSVCLNVIIPRIIMLVITIDCTSNAHHKTNAGKLKSRHQRSDVCELLVVALLRSYLRVSIRSFAIVSIRISRYELEDIKVSRHYTVY